ELATVAHLYRAYSLENRGRFAESARHIAIAERMLPHAAPDLPQGSVIEASVGTVSATVRTVGGRLRTGEQPWLAIAALLRERALPWSRVYGLILMARVTVVARDVEAALALTDEATSVSEEFGLDGMTFADLLVACRAWARAELGHTSLGEFAAVLEQRRRDGHHFFQSYLELSLAEMQIRNGQWAQAEAALERASQVTVELAWSAEVERVKGELATAQARNASTGSRRRQVDPFGKATKHFQNAIRIARDQGAALFEARATKGLVRIERLNRTTR
ncbi:MAG TPA: hypothetical protein VEB21_07335, partial [Terriglobales bacterium]|nr:hypothetical protein [Terriglobales bacterium]